MSFSIGKLAQLTGFNPMVLRAWERRHGILLPERLESGQRRYTLEDLTVLQNVRLLLDEGLKIGEIARRGRKSLEVGASAAPLPALRSAPAEDYLDGRHPDIAWAVLEALPLAVIVTDTQGRVRWVNRGVPTLCGYDLAELHGLSPGRVLQGPASDRRASEQLRAAIVSRRPGSVTLLNYHKSGEPYLALVDIAPLGVGANHVGFVGTARRLDTATAVTKSRAASSDESPDSAAKSGCCKTRGPTKPRRRT
jgi:PAS domain S-box-containing protein